MFGLLRAERVRPLLPALVIALSSGRAAPVLAVVVVGSLLVGALGWWRRTWWYADGVLHLDEGVLTRNQRRIPIERIQHVELDRRLRHQIFGLAGLRIETAGGSGAELRLDPIDGTEAEQLRAELLVSRSSAHDLRDEDEEDRAAVPEVLVRLPPGRLVLAGITGPEVAAVGAAVVFGLDALVDLGVDPTAVETVDSGDVSAALVVLVALVGVPLWFGIAGLIAVVRKWDLTATIVGDRLRVTHGLLRRRELVLQLSRVQDVRVAHRLLLRPFGRADLRIRSAASGADEQSRVDIPLLDTAEIETVLARVLPTAVPMPGLVAAPVAARRRAVVRSVVGTVPLVVLIAAVGLTRDLWWWPPVAVVAVAAGGVRGLLWYRGLGLAMTRGVVHSRTGAFSRSTSLVPTSRVQSAGVTASLFQRRRALASARIDLAGGRVTVPDRAATEARGLSAATTTR